MFFLPLCFCQRIPAFLTAKIGKSRLKSAKHRPKFDSNSTKSQLGSTKWELFISHSRWWERTPQFWQSCKIPSQTLWDHNKLFLARFQLSGLDKRRTNVQQLTCKIDWSKTFYYLFFSFVLLELKPFVLKGKVLGEKLWKSAKKCEKVWKIMKWFCPLVVAL